MQEVEENLTRFANPVWVINNKGFKDGKRIYRNEDGDIELLGLQWLPCLPPLPTVVFLGGSMCWVVARWYQELGDSENLVISQRTTRRIFSGPYLLFFLLIYIRDEIGY